MIRWDASPEPDVAGYEVVARRTTRRAVERSFDVRRQSVVHDGSAQGQLVLRRSAYDKDGYRSPVAFCGVASE
ncbi:MAG: hypothetical protein R3B46_06100 [Phycisphaerales bacterium]